MSSYAIYEQIQQRLQYDNEEITPEIINNKVLEQLLVRWEVGFNDRGMGHGDFAVITEDGLRIVECPNKEFAEHIVELHNRTTACIPSTLVHIGITEELLTKFVIFVAQRGMRWKWINEQAYEEEIDDNACIEMKQEHAEKWLKFVKSLNENPSS